MATINSLKKIAQLTVFATALSLINTSCKKKDSIEEDVNPTYTVPTTYNFNSIDTVAPRQTLAMLGELLSYIRTTHVNNAAPILSQQKLRDYYMNTNAPFSTTILNTSGFGLKDKTSNAFGLQAEFDASFADAVSASTNAAADVDSTTAYDGHAGKLINGTRYILVDADGFEYKEYIEKGVMGAVLYFQATTILNTIASFDNTTVINGLTAQERAWDQAFGYFGVPVDFPTNLKGLKNWGSYCNAVNAATGSNKTIMDAWLKGRAAISNKDNASRDEARDIVVKTWEKVSAARFITYAKGGKTNVGVPAAFNHNLSEAVGFIKAFEYNTAKTISDADINELLDYFKTGGEINLYKITPANLDNAINKMATVFNLDASKL
ncbi:MAG TPA: DUF4856 domain-containing protein [Chitinophagales bacterium]|nr:DUF4856 domain-containing protein [Chitinophagales bacterium]